MIYITLYLIFSSLKSLANHGDNIDNVLKLTGINLLDDLDDEFEFDEINIGIDEYTQAQKDLDQDLLEKLDELIYNPMQRESEAGIEHKGDNRAINAENKFIGSWSEDKGFWNPEY